MATLIVKLSLLASVGHGVHMSKDYTLDQAMPDGLVEQADQLANRLELMHQQKLEAAAKAQTEYFEKLSDLQKANDILYAQTLNISSEIDRTNRLIVASRTHISDAAVDNTKLRSRVVDIVLNLTSAVEFIETMERIPENASMLQVLHEMKQAASNDSSKEVASEPQPSKEVGQNLNDQTNPVSLVRQPLQTADTVAALSRFKQAAEEQSQMYAADPAIRLPVATASHGPLALLQGSAETADVGVVDMAKPSPHEDVDSALHALKGHLGNFSQASDDLLQTITLAFEKDQSKKNERKAKLLTDQIEFNNTWSKRAELLSKLISVVKNFRGTNSYMKTRYSSLTSFLSLLMKREGPPVSHLNKYGYGKDLALLQVAESVDDASTFLMQWPQNNGQSSASVSEYVGKQTDSYDSLATQVVKLKHQIVDYQRKSREERFQHEAIIQKEMTDDAQLTQSFAASNEALVVDIARMQEDNPRLYKIAQGIWRNSSQLMARCGSLRENLTIAIKFGVVTLNKSSEMDVPAVKTITEIDSKEAADRAKKEHERQLQNIAGIAGRFHADTDFKLPTSLLQIAPEELPTEQASGEASEDNVDQLMQEMQMDLQKSSESQKGKDNGERRSVEATLRNGEDRREKLMAQHSVLETQRQTLESQQTRIITAIDYLAERHKGLEDRVSSLKTFLWAVVQNHENDDENTK